MINIICYFCLTPRVYPVINSQLSFIININTTHTSRYFLWKLHGSYEKDITGLTNKYDRTCSLWFSDLKWRLTKCELLVSFSITVTEDSNNKYYRECDWSILTAEGCDWPIAGATHASHVTFFFGVKHTNLSKRPYTRLHKRQSDTGLKFYCV